MLQSDTYIEFISNTLQGAKKKALAYKTLTKRNVIISSGKFTGRKYLAFDGIQKIYGFEIHKKKTGLSAKIDDAVDYFKKAGWNDFQLNTYFSNKNTPGFSPAELKEMNLEASIFLYGTDVKMAGYSKYKHDGLKSIIQKHRRT